MKIRSVLGVVCVLVGASVALYGLGSALMELIGLYSGALNDPLAEPRNGGERGVSARMVRDVWIGVAGVPVLILGYVLLQIGLLGWLWRKKK